MILSIIYSRHPITKPREKAIAQKPRDQLERHPGSHLED